MAARHSSGPVVAAIIGHGLSPEGKGWGPRIDACDLVFRLWDCQWQSAADYGQKYDYGYYTAHRGYIRTMLQHRHRKPRVAWIAQGTDDPVQTRSSGPRAQLAGPPESKLFFEDGWLEIGLAMGGMGSRDRFHLTRGACTACWAGENLPEGSTIVLVGFDNVRECRVLPLDKAFPAACRKNPGTLTFERYAGHGTVDGPHDFTVEGRIIAEVAAKRGITVVHALDRWASSKHDEPDYVIVGHGRSVQGKSWGHRIDSAGTVLRMWDWHWQDAPDYGTRYDIGFYEAHHSERLSAHNKREPAMKWLVSLTPWAEGPPKSALAIDQQPWIEKGMAMGGAGVTGKLKFTRGTQAAIWALTAARPGWSVVLAGFDNVRDGVCHGIEAGFPQAYREAETTYTFAGYAPGKTKHGNHDFTVERKLLEHIAMERGVHLMFAQDVW